MKMDLINTKDKLFSFWTNLQIDAESTYGFTYSMTQLVDIALKEGRLEPENAEEYAKEYIKQELVFSTPPRNI